MLWISFIKFYYQLPHEIKDETLLFSILLYYFRILLFNIIMQDFTKKIWKTISCVCQAEIVRKILISTVL
jgi:hypothetical protein